MAERGNRSVEAVSQECKASNPVRRYRTLEEYGDVVWRFRPARASYVTGSVIRVDGGLIASIQKRQLSSKSGDFYVYP